MKTIFFAPHPDDETFACGGTIALKTARGEDVGIVMMTDGRNSHSMMGIFEDPSPAELVEMRRKEFEKATSILGVKRENLIFLGFEDIHLYASREAAHAEVSMILAVQNPSEVFIPARNEFHPDHISTNLIVTRSLDGLGMNPVAYEYNVIPTMEPRSCMETIMVDISSTLAKKREAIKVYKSQLNLISPTQRRPVVSAQELVVHMRGTERFMRVR